MPYALLVIDMQKGSFTKKTPRYDTEGVVDRINFLAKSFRENGHWVIFIQHDGTKMNEFIPGTVEWELLSSLDVFPEDIVVSKTANDAFYKSKLDEILTQFDIEQLFITGCATDFCVESTVQSALSKNHKITIIKDGHTTADRPSLKAKEVIEHYNWVWQNMIPTDGQIAVSNSMDLELKP